MYNLSFERSPTCGLILLMSVLYSVKSLRLDREAKDTLSGTTNNSHNLPYVVKESNINTSIYADGSEVNSSQSTSDFELHSFSKGKQLIFTDERNLSKVKKIESWPCVNWCRYTDKNLNDCWKHSLKYHAMELMEKVEHLYSALLHVDHWKRSNLEKDDPDLKKHDFEMEVLLDTLSSSGNETGSEATVNRTAMKQIFDIVLLEFEKKRDHFHANEAEGDDDDVPFLPPLSCPVTCDYYPKIWVTLAAILSLTLMLIIIVILLYLFCDSWSPRYRGKWRLV